MVAGALPLLAAMLQSSEQSVQTAALDALWPLMFAGTNKTTDAVMSAGRIVQSLEKLSLCNEPLKGTAL